MAHDIVDELVKRLVEEITPITEYFEIILVEDGSIDDSWLKIEENCQKDPRIKGLKLSRNFGQHYAITAGLIESTGDLVILMDCDLQDNPKYIPDLINKHKQGFDIVYTVHNSRKHGVVKNFFATCFHSVFNWLVGSVELNSSGKVGTYSLLTKKVVNAFCEIKDYHRHYLSVLRWLGYSSSYILTDHELRFSGKTSYSFKKLVLLAIDGIISQTDKLLRLNIYIGFFLSIVGFFSIIYIVIISISAEGFQPGWASSMVLIIFSTGLILSSMGIIGLYIAKIFDQTKDRPLYLVDKKLNI